MSTYDTNLAAEFHVLSVLHRLGIEASLTLGNKKAVDIIISTPHHKTMTLDVKGLAGSFDWPADNIKLPSAPNHYFALVSFEGKISDPVIAPNVWLIPGRALKPFIKEYKSRKVVSRALIKKKAGRYLQAWSRFIVNSGA